MAEEATINTDGSTTFEGAASGGGDESTMPPVDDSAGGAGTEGYADEETMGEAAEKVAQGVDPAIYLLVAVVLLGVLYFFYRRKVKADEEDEFFSNLDGEKVRK